MTLSELWRNVNKPQNSSSAIRFCYSLQCCHCAQTEHFQNSVTAIRKEQEKSSDNKSAGKEAYIPEDPREHLPGLVLSPIVTLVSLHYGRYIPMLYNTLKSSVLQGLPDTGYFLKMRMTKAYAAQVISRNPDGQKRQPAGNRAAATYQ